MFISALMAMGVAGAMAGEVPVRPSDTLIVDQLGVLSDPARSEINALNDRLRIEKAGAELGVLVVSTTGAEIANSYATRAFKQWQLGSAAGNNGVLLMVAKDDRKVELILGDGIDNDSQVFVAQRIVSEYITPRFKQGKFEEGIIAGSRQSARQLLGLAGTGSNGQTPLVDRPVREPVNDNSDGGNGGGVPTSVVGGVGVTVLGGLGVAGRMLLRRRPRKCAKCSNQMSKLDESADDAKLQKGQISEERVGSVDYDVWVCNHCDGAQILRYGKLFSRYKPCPKCGAKTKWSTSSTVVAATTSSTGTKRIDEACSN